MNFKRALCAVAACLVFSLTLAAGVSAQNAPPAQNPQQGSVGLQGEIKKPPPDKPAIITLPGNGQTFTSTPITVAGICETDLLVEVYKNNVFGGSTVCKNGSFSLQVDLFDGQNDLIVRVYDSINQAGPDSTTVSVTYNAPKISIGPRITLVTAYAKRGANPGSVLDYPITISGGLGPYALSVDWGDKTPADLQSRPFAGEVSPEHTYKQSGLYTIIMRATDSGGNVAYMQVVGIGNGPIQQTDKTVAGGTVITNTKVIWWPLVVALVLIIVAFWLGKRQQIEEIRGRLRAGKKPF
jgi:hypothetical protein